MLLQLGLKLLSHLVLLCAYFKGDCNIFAVYGRVSTAVAVFDCFRLFSTVFFPGFMLTEISEMTVSIRPSEPGTQFSPLRLSITRVVR